MRLQPVLFALILLLGFTFSAHANLVANSGFESNDLTDWTLTPGANPLTVVDNLSPYDGLYAASFGAFESVDTLSQSLGTTASKTYELSFWLSNTDTLHANTFEVWWNGTLLQSWVNADPFAYSQFNYYVTATSTATTLEFKGFNDDGYYRLDDVNVPEPALAGLFSLGLVGLALFRKRQGAV